MKNSFYFPIFLFLIVLQACSPQLTPFTQRFYDSYNFDESDLKQIQFYVSDDIVLSRAKGDGNVQITDGKVRVVDGKQVDEVIIPKGTPGVLLFIPKEDRFAISFDESGEEKYLMFGPNRKLNNHYALLASDWDRRTGTITYGGEKYYTRSNSGLAKLMIDLKAVKRIERKSSVAKGRTVN